MVHYTRRATPEKPSCSTAFPRRCRCVAALGLAACVIATGAPAGAAPTRDTVRLGQNKRVVVSEEISRVAVGDPRVAAVQMISNREMLILGRSIGQTNLLLWFVDGGVSERLVRVQRDLGLLSRAIRDIHPAISVTDAPEGTSVVLTGVVPDIRYSRAAEALARDYLRGGTGLRTRGSGVIVGAPDGEPQDPGEAAQEDAFLLEEQPGRDVGRVVNLIRVEDVPPPLERRLEAALEAAGGADIRVSRLTAGALPDDSTDSFVLDGHVASQVELVRALLSAARVLDPGASGDSIRVIADEAGALGSGSVGVGGAGTGATLGGVGISGAGQSANFGGGGVTGNNLQANVARAKALSVLGGRILSFVEVDRIPQVRLETRLFEINRSRLRNWSPNFNILIGDTENVELLPSLTSLITQGEDAPVITKGDVQGALSLLNGGTMLGGFQMVSDNLAIDLALNMLEQESIARALARPALSVLSGEVATFNAGGQIPITVTVDTTTSATSGALLSSTIFAEFGVSVSVRPLVSEDDIITLDVTPSISQPDFDLTEELVDSTGSEQSTTAFQTRSLRTTTRVRDGQSFVIGGLLQTTMSRGTDFTPWFHRVPGLGWLGKSRDDQRDELDFVIVISPSIVQEPIPRSNMWVYPTSFEMLDSLGLGVGEESTRLGRVH